MPSMINMKKNRRDQKVEPGRVAIAWGYTSNTRLGPTNIAVYTLPAYRLRIYSFEIRLYNCYVYN